VGAKIMTLHPTEIWVIPEEIARIARATFPKGNVYMKMRDTLGQLYFDSELLSLFRCDCGQPAYSPAKLALISIMQFAEGLTDRQAAEAVRSRIDWKYACLFIYY
jgi:transposase